MDVDLLLTVVFLFYLTFYFQFQLLLESHGTLL